MIAATSAAEPATLPKSRSFRGSCHACASGERIVNTKDEASAFFVGEPPRCAT